MRLTPRQRRLNTQHLFPFADEVRRLQWRQVGSSREDTWIPSHVSDKSQTARNSSSGILCEWEQIFAGWSHCIPAGDVSQQMAYIDLNNEYLLVVIHMQYFFFRKDALSFYVTSSSAFMYILKDENENSWEKDNFLHLSLQDLDFFVCKWLLYLGCSTESSTYRNTNSCGMN